MPRGSVQKPFFDELVASAARTATGNSGNLVFPTDQDGGVFILRASTVTGTSPTLDVAIQIDFEAATNLYFTMWRFAQVTVAANRRIITSFRRVAEAGAESAVADTGGALANNCPVSRRIRVLWTIGGTNPSFTFQVLFLGARAGLGAGY